MKHTLPLSLVAAVACAGIAVASINPDVGYHPAQHHLQVYAPVNEVQLNDDDLAVFALMSQAEDMDLDTAICGDHAAMTRDLAQNFGETRQDDTLDGGEVWASADFGTWTLLERQSDGLSCVAYSGTGWTDATSPSETLRLAGLL